MNVAVFDPSQAGPPVLRSLFSATELVRCHLISRTDVDPARHRVPRFDAAIFVDASVHSRSHGDGRETFSEAAGRMAAICGAWLVLTDRPDHYRNTGRTAVCLPTHSPIELVHGALLGLAAGSEGLARAASERDYNQRLHESVRRHVETLDAELRLASRLQRDFLPRENQEMGPAAFSTLYRPCAWVSGDVFDIFQIDASHIGFYLADAVGHGLAAGLLTMYVKHAMTTHRLSTDALSAARPSAALQRLNDQIARHELHDSPFVTCWYGVLNTATRRLEYSSAGHPPALWVREDRPLAELFTDGGLLGMTAGQPYETRSVQLEKGDRLILYSDGLDNVLIAERRPLPQPPIWCDGVETLLRFPMSSLLTSLETRLDNLPGSLNKGDDATVLVMDLRS